jgi:hypothetical protein
VQVALSLTDGADQQSGSLNELFVLLLAFKRCETAANVQSFAVGEDDGFHTEELFDDSAQKV